MAHSLALILVIGGVVVAQYGARLGTKRRGEELGAALALLTLVIAFLIAVSLLLPPHHVYSLQAAIPQLAG